MAFDFFKRQARKQANAAKAPFQGINKMMNTKGPGPASQAQSQPFPGFKPFGKPKSRDLPTVPNVQGPPLQNEEPRTAFPAQLPGPGPAQVPAVSPRQVQPIAQPLAPPPAPAQPAAPAPVAQPAAQPVAPSIPQPPAQGEIGRSENAELKMAMKRSMQQAVAAGDMAKIEEIRGHMAQLEGPVEPPRAFQQGGPVSEAQQTLAQANQPMERLMPSEIQEPTTQLAPTPPAAAPTSPAQQNPAMMEGIQAIQQAQSRGDMAQIRQIAGQMLQRGVDPMQLAGYFQQLGIGREVIDRFLKPRFG